jgi:L-threonylcarbamoyladenylate synthase
VFFAKYGARRDPARAARELFDALRRLDSEGVDEILASAPTAHGIGLAIVDRLTRAAEGRVKRL